MKIKIVSRAAALFSVALLTLGAGSCDEVASKPFEAFQIDLAIGQTETLPQAGVTLTFLEVAEDSRCPEDVVCVWEGNAAVALNVEFQGGRIDTTLNSSLDPQAVEVNGIDIRFVGLSPYPRTDHEIDPIDYVLTVELSRN